METFIVRCEGIEKKVKYEDKKTAEALADYIHYLEQKEYLSLDEELRERYEHEDENPLYILNLLTAKHPESFIIAYTIGDILQEQKIYEESIHAFEQAFSIANHATFKLKASLGLGLSWKRMGDEQTDVRKSAFCYHRSTLYLDQAELYDYAATPELAVLLNYTAASVNVVGARNQIDVLTQQPELKKKIPEFKKYILDFLTLSKIYKTLSMNVAEYYAVKDIEQEYPLMDVDIDNLEKELSTL